MKMTTKPSIRTTKRACEHAPEFDTVNMRYPDEFYSVMMLREKYGDVTLGSILAKFSPIGFKCPQCDGTGKVEEKYATDMLAVATGCADWQYRDVECPLCHGTGAVPKKLKPKMVQDGWTEAELC
jgi:hypothetical protein